MSKDNDNMSSVSNCSKFSSKSQKVISNMRSMLLAAGLDPNAAFTAAGGDVEDDMEVDEEGERGGRSCHKYPCHSHNM